MMDHTEKIVKGLVINGVIFVGLALGLLVLNQILWQSWLDNLYLIALFGLGTLQFLANMILSLILWVREKPDTAWGYMASGTAVPMVGILLIYGVTRLFV
jgi:hypothetical protein